MATIAPQIEAWHLTLHARPKGAISTRPLVIAGRKMLGLDLRPDQLQSPMAVSFEESLAALALQPRLFLEPDGSFVWVSAFGSATVWQLDGQLYDRAGRLLYVEIKGRCPGAEWDVLLSAFGHDRQPLIVQFLREAVFIAAEDFHREWNFSPRGADQQDFVG